MSETPEQRVFSCLPLYAMCDLPICRSNSLLLPDNSLFFELLSLLVYVGNYAKSRCGSAVRVLKLPLGGLRIVNFPVKFPVTREFLRRPVRSALRRQPGSPATGDFTPSNVRNACHWPGFANWRSVSDSGFGRFRLGLADSLRRIVEIFPFLGSGDRRPGSIGTAGPSLQCNSPNSPPLQPVNRERRARADQKARTGKII
jgi:hypothetical protein